MPPPPTGFGGDDCCCCCCCCCCCAPAPHVAAGEGPPAVGPALWGCWWPAAVAGGAALLRRVTFARMTPLSKAGTSAASSVTSIQTAGLAGASARRVLKRKW
jgi:hypothetical protein